MFVSKKTYAEAVGVAQEWRDLFMAAKAELDALKASRASSNENLKLGTAASAKARRKKVEPPSPLDWSKPIVSTCGRGAIVTMRPDQQRMDCFKKCYDIQIDGGARRTVDEYGRSALDNTEIVVRNVA